MAESVTLPYDVASAATARASLAAALSAAGIYGTARDDAVLVVSELVGNSLRHARPLRDGTIQVHWDIRSNEILIEVCDGGGGRPRVRHPGTEETSGRGLAIVERVAVAWGSREDDESGVVWARLRVRVGATPPRRRDPRRREVEQPQDRYRDLGDRGEQLVG